MSTFTQTVAACRLSKQEFRWLWKNRGDPDPGYSKSEKMRRIRRDAKRWVPFSVFLVMPFGGLMLPVYLMFYQDAVPSQFHSVEEKQKRYYTIAARAEVARGGLHDLLQKEPCSSASAYLSKACFPTIADAMIRTFMTQVWAGTILPNADAVSKFVAVLGKGPVTGLHHLGRLLAPTGIRPKLSSPFVRVVGGPYLRWRLRRSIRLIADTDQLLIRYGNEKTVNALTREETIQAALLRGIRVLPNRSEEEVKRELIHWVEMRKKGVPVEAMVFVAGMCQGIWR